eukprot:CAMPEP_0178731196 /NCGR_PEP_ID=MMETSP0699-20121125/29914_1 /TAXON_ID=265572 /ORGANISM="Extubocellulus spinifer, Strain CCMP396" /LENGTH=150 /DNA_ID=CAMNT_0020383253 /DNA_START=300 /DNA_END=752 /DNA_ORIENTATION=-
MTIFVFGEEANSWVASMPFHFSNSGDMPSLTIFWKEEIPFASMVGFALSFLLFFREHKLHAGRFLLGLDLGFDGLAKLAREGNVLQQDVFNYYPPTTQLLRQFCLDGVLDHAAATGVQRFRFALRRQTSNGAGSLWLDQQLHVIGADTPV